MSFMLGSDNFTKLRIRRVFLVISALWGDYSIRKKKREQIESLQQQLRLCSVNPSDNHECNIERLVLDSQLVSHFHSLASKASRVSDAEWNALMQLLEIHFPVFTQRISSPQLTESERRVCMLIRLRFVPTEMAALMDVSVQQITNIRSRINSKLFRRKGAQGVDVLLNSIRWTSVMIVKLLISCCCVVRYVSVVRIWMY